MSDESKMVVIGCVHSAGVARDGAMSCAPSASSRPWPGSMIPSQPFCRVW